LEDGHVPELPEIEALRELIGREYAGRRVEAVAVRQFALVKTFDPAPEELIGEELVGARRHGKHLLIDFGGTLTMAIHLSIGGRLVPAAATAKPGRGVSLDLMLDDDRQLRVVELGTKKRSSVHFLRSDQVEPHLQALGIDALSSDLTVELLLGMLAGDRSQLKGFLENQHHIAGIGNAYSDEILWEAELPPLKMTDKVTPEEAARLLDAIRSVLQAAIERAWQDNYLLVARGDERHTFQVHRRPSDPCPRCGEKIASIFYADNSLQYCPACQHDGKAYADRRLSRLFK
jgi:formamidopyrimidine-DNA glycosylase